MDSNKYYIISVEKEVCDSFRLAEIISKDEWMDEGTIIVTCSPDYSSIHSQILNHKLSVLNNNELYEQLFLEMPYPIMSQVWDRESSQFQVFDRYLNDWILRYVKKGYKYLFLDSGTIRGKNFTKVSSLLKNKLERTDYRFASLYLEEHSNFVPDYYVEKFSAAKDGGLLFSWENPNNPNWNY